MENSYFKSRDFYISTCLIASGQRLLRLIKNGGTFVTFVFDCSPETAEAIISDHWSRRLVVPTRNLIEAINELKTRIHQQ